jgi:glycosyltransferase involved in cell wall biosynthesis
MDIERYCRNRVSKYFIKKIINTSNYILVLGNRSKSFWMDMGFNEHRIRIMPSSIDTETEFFPQRIEYLYDLLFIGTLDDNKRIISIMMSVQQLVRNGHNIKFALAGFGPLEGKVKLFIKENNLEKNIIFLGEIDNILETMISSRLFIMASEFEGLPCALMEAMACEKIVLTTPAGDIPDIVKDGVTGFVLYDSDHTVIAERIKNVLKNFNDYSIIAKNARDIIIKDVSFRTTTQKWNKLLSEIKNENYH